MTFTADILVGLSYGDEGKGCVTNALLKTGGYTHCVKSNGGHNSGHTIVHEGKKIVTHAVPSGVVQGIKSIIGPGCVVNFSLLNKEIEELEAAGVNVRDFLYIDERVNIIETEHLEEDSHDSKIGTTRRGNGPAYRDKYGRKNRRFGDVSTSVNSINVYDEFFETNEEVNVLFEGGQGFYLDIDWGDYPYVTSSHCTTAGAMLNGVPPQSVRNVYGIAKAYDTYVGAKSFEPDNPLMSKIREVGNEYGSTTGRPRQVNYLNVDDLVRAIRVNGVTTLIVNKVDILEEVGVWKVYVDGKLIDLESKQGFTDFLSRYIVQRCATVCSIKFSTTPDGI
jgi:adenylosuccinate synthase